MKSRFTPFLFAVLLLLSGCVSSSTHEREAAEAQEAGYAAPISMILGGAGGLTYLFTFYQRSTKKTIDLMCAAHRASLLGSLRRSSPASSHPPIGGGSSHSNKRTRERPEA